MSSAVTSTHAHATPVGSVDIKSASMQGCPVKVKFSKAYVKQSLQGHKFLASGAGPTSEPSLISHPEGKTIYWFTKHRTAYLSLYIVCQN